jgi:hypothetical protein
MALGWSCRAIGVSLQKALLPGINQELFELAVGVGVGGELECSGWIHELELSEGHATAEFGIGLTEGERFAQAAEAGFEVGDALGVEIGVEIWG